MHYIITEFNVNIRKCFIFIYSVDFMKNFILFPMIITPIS